MNGEQKFAEFANTKALPYKRKLNINFNIKIKTKTGEGKKLGLEKVKTKANNTVFREGNVKK